MWRCKIDRHIRCIILTFFICSFPLGPRLDSINVMLTGNAYITLITRVSIIGITRTMRLNESALTCRGEGNLRPRRPPREYLGEYTS